jgi:hypothetical protein
VIYFILTAWAAELEKKINKMKNRLDRQGDAQRTP